MDIAKICEAIGTKKLIQFDYTGDDALGFRTVEPHMVAYSKAEKLVLCCWYLGGASESQEGPGWREYLIGLMSNITVLPQQFAGPRPGYKPDGGKTLHNVQCGL
jgi:hypothetical protein